MKRKTTTALVLCLAVVGTAIEARAECQYVRGGIAETAAIVRIPTAGGHAEVLAAPAESPQDMAVDRAGVFVLLSSLGRKNDPDRIVALERHQP